MRMGGGDGATVGGAVMVRMVRVGREVVRVGGRRVGEGGGGSVAVIVVRVGREGTVWGAISVVIRRKGGTGECINKKLSNAIGESPKSLTLDCKLICAILIIKSGFCAFLALFGIINCLKHHYSFHNKRE